jgi:hypothetical protein
MARNLGGKFFYSGQFQDGNRRPNNALGQVHELLIRCLRHFKAKKRSQTKWFLLALLIKTRATSKLDRSSDVVVEFLASHGHQGESAGFPKENHTNPSYIGAPKTSSSPNL